MSFSIKAQLSGVIRRVKLPTNVKNDQATRLIMEAYGITDESAVVLQYKDSDGDIITIGTDDDWIEIHDLVNKKENIKILVINSTSSSGVISLPSTPSVSVPPTTNPIEETTKASPPPLSVISALPAIVAASTNIPSSSVPATAAATIPPITQTAKNDAKAEEKKSSTPTNETAFFTPPTIVAYSYNIVRDTRAVSKREIQSLALSMDVVGYIKKMEKTADGGIHLILVQGVEETVRSFLYQLYLKGYRLKMESQKKIDNPPVRRGFKIRKTAPNLLENNNSSGATASASELSAANEQVRFADK